MSDSELSPPRIVCAANRNAVSGEIAIGVRHFCPVMVNNIRAMCAKSGVKYLDRDNPYALAWRQSEQGFIDQHGQFYNREQAWEIADKNGQIFRDRDWQTGSLHSEHLY